MKLNLEAVTYYLLVFILIMGLTLAITNTQKKVEGQKGYILITMSEGDTLWKVNERYKEFHGLSFVDFVTWIEDVNQTKSELLVPGDQLIIPLVVGYGGMSVYTYEGYEG